MHSCGVCMCVYVCVGMCECFCVSVNTIVFALVRNSDRLGNGVLYASVNPEYFSAAESELCGA